MRVITTGWRHWSDSLLNTQRLFTFMDSLLEMTLMTHNPVLQVVHGGAPGADTKVQEWVRANREEFPYAVMDSIVYPADWQQYGKVAGPMRNTEMVARGADLGVAFLHPECKGTVDCLNKIREAHILPLVVPWVDDSDYNEKKEALRVARAVQGVVGVRRAA